jgi:hypothetical protein
MTIKVPPSMSTKKTGLMGRVGEKCTKRALVFHKGFPPEFMLWRSLNMTIKFVSSCDCHLILGVILSLPVFVLCLKLMGKSRESV